MGVLNTLLGRGGLESLLPVPQPFEELRLLPGTEVYRNARVTNPLDEHFMAGPFEEPAEITGNVMKGERVIISVDKEMCFTRQLTVPQISQTRTTAVLELELSRVIPFARDGVVAAFVDTHAEAPEGGRVLEQVVIRKDIFSAALETLKSAGARSIAIVVRAGNEPALPIALALDGTPFRKGAFENGLKTALAAMIAVVLAGGFTAWATMTQAQNRDDALAAALASASSEAAKVREALDLQLRGSQALRSLVVLKSGNTGVLVVVEELSRLLPGEAYLDGMTIDGKTLTADGAATAPELLISELEASPLFENVAFAAPVFKNPGEVKSRFSIRLDLSEPPKS
jgi:general secretion pathway protein L